MERQIDSFAIPERIQKLQRLDAPFEHALAALCVHVFRGVTGHRGDDLDFLHGEKLRQIFIAGLEQNRKIAAVDHMPRWRERFHAFDEIAKIRNHFRRATGKIDNRYLGLCQPIDDPIDGLARHDFPALWSSVHMAMCASEIAKLAEINLKNFRASATEQDRVLRKFLRKPIHPMRNQQQLPPSRHLLFASVVTS